MEERNDDPDNLYMDVCKALAATSKLRNHEKQNIFSFFTLSLFLKKMIIVIIIIPNPTKVFKVENPGIGAISEGKKNFANDSGIICKFVRSADNPKILPEYEKSLIALERNHNQNIPETA